MWVAVITIFGHAQKHTRSICTTGLSFLQCCTSTLQVGHLVLDVACRWLYVKYVFRVEGFYWNKANYTRNSHTESGDPARNRILKLEISNRRNEGAHIGERTDPPTHQELV